MEHLAQDDGTLLRRYLDGSEEAFAELVQRHINAVYNTALRMVGGDAHLAKDVAQKVFTSLARKAASLANRPILVGWLYQSTHYEAAATVRTERRWRSREQKAHAMNEIENEGAPEPDWTNLRPAIDSALRDLKDSDRDALLLRFFQTRTLAEIGALLGLSENAARMRVDRALEKLRERLVRRGIKSTAAALSAALAGQITVAAPPTLAATIATTALAGTATAGSTTLLFMGMTKLQTTLTAALVVAGGSALWSQKTAESKLRAEIAVLAGQTENISPLQADKARLEASAKSVATLHAQAATLDALRNEEAQLRQAALERARKSEPQKLSDGQLCYTLKQLDTMPVPTKRQQPVYPLALKKLGVGGDVLLEFVLKADGTVSNISVIKSTHEALTESSIKALSQWTFKPGQKSGQPVHARMRQPFVYAIDHGDVENWF